MYICTHIYIYIYRYTGKHYTLGIKSATGLDVAKSYVMYFIDQWDTYNYMGAKIFLTQSIIRWANSTISQRW